MSSSSRWMAVVGFPIVGFVLLWWAGEQSDAIRQISGTTFQWPAWRGLGWIITLVAVGAAFSVAASAARTGESRARMGPTLVVVALPIAVVIYWVTFSSGWMWTFGTGVSFWVLGDSTPIVAASFIVGFLLTDLATSRINWSE